MAFSLLACSSTPYCDHASTRALGDQRCVLDWPVYGGQASANRYSALTQITPANVAQLQPAWRYDTHESGESQTNPLIIGRVLYAYTPGLKVIALDAATGQLLWQFDSGIHGSGPHRGLAYWSDGRDRRLLAGVMNYLYALDPATGRPIASFGDHGRIDLRAGLQGDASRFYVSLTSPGMIYRDLLIVGFRTSESKPAPPADIRAYDVHSGALRWSFHTIPHPGEFGYDSWPANAWQYSGSANNWAGFALDVRRGIVYVPTGSAVDDFYGADRLGDDLFADSLVALDARSGRRLWHFQETHHDIWDRDLPAQPALLTVTRAGRRIDAIAQTSKQGYLFLFDRLTGAPLFPIVEQPYPASDVPGEVTAPTQPRPLAPEPFARQRLTEELLTNRTPEARAWALQQFRGFRSDGQFVPFAVGQPTVIFPGFDGGAEWGGPAVDPVHGILYVNANDVAWTGMLLPNRPAASAAEGLYQAQCSACHGVDRAGSAPAFPSLLELGGRLSQAQIAQVIHDGRGRMPPFPALSGTALAGLLQWLNPQSSAGAGMSAPLSPEAIQAPYRFTGYAKFLDPDGYPAVLPPWGTLSAIDLNTGASLWRVPLGEYPELRAQGLPVTGSENYGGPILTASGVLFIGATVYDHKIRAFESSSGRLLWESELPFAGTATPATYLVDGRQYLVIATSNARNRNGPQGGAYVAFALPGGT